MSKRATFLFPFLLFAALVCGCGANIGAGNPGGGAPTTITFTITGVTPTAVATKIGSGPFTPVTLTSGAATITIPSNETSFAVAYFCTALLSPSGNAPSEVAEQDVFEGTTLDGNSFSGACLPGLSTPPPAAPTAQLTGSVDASAIPGVSSLTISVGNSDFDMPFTDASSFGFAAPTGTDRVLLLAYDDVYSPPAPSGSTTLAAAKSFNSQAVPGALNGGNSVVLGLQDETTPVAVTYSNLPSGFIIDFSSASLVTSAGSANIIASPATKQYVAIPMGATESGDYYSIYMDAYSGSSVMSVVKNLTSAVPVAVTFPPGWSYAGPTPAAQPVFNVAYQGFSGDDGVSYVAAWNWWPAGNGTQYSATVTATGNYLNGATSVSMPDLSGLAGTLAPPVPGTSVNWTARIFQATYESQPASLANETLADVQNSGTYQVP